MAPELVGNCVAFTTSPSPEAGLVSAAIAMVREAEGVTLVVPAELAPDAPLMRQITLNVHSALDGVGLTAAVSTALADAGIPANVVAGYHHDHIFVPEEQAEHAVDVLKSAAKAADD